MNKENLLKGADFIEKIPDFMFYMGCYRDGQEETPECDSIGCALGHLTALFPDKLTYTRKGTIKFWDMCEDVFGITDDMCENYLFSPNWDGIDNSPILCAERMRFVAEKGEKAGRDAWHLVCDENDLVF